MTCWVQHRTSQTLSIRIEDVPCPPQLSSLGRYSLILYPCLLGNAESLRYAALNLGKVFMVLVKRRLAHWLIQLLSQQNSSQTPPALSMMYSPPKKTLKRVSGTDLDIQSIQQIKFKRVCGSELFNCGVWPHTVQVCLHTSLQTGILLSTFLYEGFSG